MRTLSRRSSSPIGNRSKTSRRLLLALLSLGLFTATGAAESPALEFKWDELEKHGPLPGGVVLPPETGSAFYRLRVENTAPQPKATTVWSLDRPTVGGPRYAVTGNVRYDNVEAVSYLELWNHFPDGSRYFSRTLGETGPMQKLTGSSGWRSFALPFDATGAPAPSRLVVNVVLGGRGRVELGPLTLTTLPGPVDGSNRLWTNRMAGLTGGIGGAFVGGLGALIGVLTSLGRARRLVMAVVGALIAFGVASTAGGLVALAASQPYAVFYPLLLFGVLSSVVPVSLLPAIRRRYAEIELRTMRAHDIG
jgi:hypothetical protein